MNFSTQSSELRTGRRRLPRRWTVGAAAVCLSLLLAGCATGRSAQPLLRAYQGVPPEGYPYRSLGEVYGEYTTDVGLRDQYVQYVAREAMMSLAEEARALGANAIIEVRREPGEGRMRHMFRYRGEAVVFEQLPPE